MASFLAAGDVFPFGVLFVSIPIVVLILFARFVTKKVGNPIWPMALGGTCAAVFVVLTVLFADEHPNGVIDQHIAVAVNLAACGGAIIGAAISLLLRTVRHLTSRQ